MMNNLIFDDYPIVVSPKLAQLVGLNCAVFLQQLHYWLKESKHVYDGKKWVYNTYESWQKQFLFWSVSTLKRIVKHLKEMGLIEVTSKYNKMKMDRTLWYTINYEQLNNLTKASNSVNYAEPQQLTQSAGNERPNDEKLVNYVEPQGLTRFSDDITDTIWSDHSVKMTPPKCQNDTMESVKLTRPITRDYPETTTNNITTNTLSLRSNTTYRSYIDEKKFDDDVKEISNTKEETEDTTNVKSPEPIRNIVLDTLKKMGITADAVKNDLKPVNCNYTDRQLNFLLKACKFAKDAFQKGIHPCVIDYVFWRIEAKNYDVDNPITYAEHIQRKGFNPERAKEQGWKPFVLSLKRTRQQALLKLGTAYNRFTSLLWEKAEMTPEELFALLDDNKKKMLIADARRWGEENGIYEKDSPIHDESLSDTLLKYAYTQAIRFELPKLQKKKKPKNVKMDESDKPDDDDFDYSKLPMFNDNSNLAKIARKKFKQLHEK